MNYGITPQGFVRKTYAVILAEREAQAVLPEFFGPAVDLSPLQMEGAILRMMSYALADVWQEVENVYYALQLDTAEGVHLDRVVHLGNRSRKLASRASVPLQMTGVPGSPVTTADRVKTLTGVQFAPIEDGVISPEGDLEIVAQASETGESGNVGAGAISQFVNPIPGVDTVTNDSQALGGEPTESDPELHARYNADETVTGSSAAAIEGALNDMPGVFATVFENTGETVDERGIPPHRFECVVIGGVDAEIAQKIFEHMPAGIRPYGTSVTFPIVDSRGRIVPIQFSRPVDVEIYVIYRITADADWTGEHANTIIARTIEHIGGFNSTTNTAHDGLGVGGTVKPWRLESLHAGIPGIVDLEAWIGTASAPTLRNPLQMGSNQRPAIYNVNIEIVIL